MIVSRRPRVDEGEWLSSENQLALVTDGGHPDGCLAITTVSTYALALISHQEPPCLNTLRCCAQQPALHRDGRRTSVSHVLHEAPSVHAPRNGAAACSAASACRGVQYGCGTELHLRILTSLVPNLREVRAVVWTAGLHEQLKLLILRPGYCSKKQSPETSQPRMPEELMEYVGSNFDPSQPKVPVLPYCVS